mgnify:FL=1
MSEPKSLKRKITTKPLSEKYKAIQDIDKGLSKKDAAEKYGVPFSTLSTWLKSKDKISAAYEKGKNPKTLKLKKAGSEALDKAIFKWFLRAREQNIPINGDVLKENA